MDQHPEQEIVAKLKEEIALLEQKVEQERQARETAEKLLKNKSRELHHSNDELTKLNESLEKNISRRTNTLISLIRNLHSGVLLEDENRRIMLINEKFCRIFNMEYNPEIFIGQDCREFSPFSKNLFEEPEAFERKTAERVEKREIKVNEVLKMEDGRVLERDFLPIYSGEEYLGHLWQYREITEQFLFEKKIRQSEEKYRGIIENMELGLLEVDGSHNIIKAYNWFCDMTGYTEEELIGKNVKELFLSEGFYSEKNEKKGQSIYEVQMRRKDGEVIWVLIGRSPFYDETGKFAGSIDIHYNITDRKQLENELREAREAEKQFLANMSHEIRNPINAVAGIINLLYDTKLSDEQLNYLNNIKYAADILLGLISDILDLSKIEAGKMEIVEKPIEIGEIIRAVVQTYSFKTSHKNLRFTSDIDPRLSEPVLAAPTIINQILLNLIGNAVKFTETGDINVRAEVKKDTEESVEVEMTITDTGIGISEEQQKMIFESFHQADMQIKLKYGGTGLGLSIVKQLLGFYDGSINVTSKPGEGSAFTFTLNLKKAKQDEFTDEKPNQKNLSTDRIARVLIVEDNKINQQYLIGLLKKWGIAYDLANHGEEAMEFIERNKYQLVLMDIRMPVMDGYETTIRIRNATNNPNRDIPIIALTASALVDEKERALTAGMNFHLTKPFSPDQLLGILDQLNPVSSEMVPGDVQFHYSEDLDQKYLESFYEDDLERAALMFEMFLNNIDKEIDDLRDFFEKQDWKGFASLAHRIKPNFIMVGLTDYTNLMQELEKLAKEEQVDKLKEIVPDFLDEFKIKRKIVEKELTSISSYLELGNV